jgi:hypothetical protein
MQRPAGGNTVYNSDVLSCGESEVPTTRISEETLAEALSMVTRHEDSSNGRTLPPSPELSAPALSRASAQRPCGEKLAAVDAHTVDTVPAPPLPSPKPWPPAFLDTAFRHPARRRHLVVWGVMVASVAILLMAAVRS